MNCTFWRTLPNRVSEKIFDKNGIINIEIARNFDIYSLLRQVSFGSENSGPIQKIDYQYDKNLNSIGWIKDINGANLKHSFTLDGLKRPDSFSNNQGSAKVTIKYDGTDRAKEIKDYKNVITYYTQDALGNTTQESNWWDMGTIEWSYDANGLLASTTDAMNRTIAIDRDALGRITQLNYDDGASSQLKYDLSGATYNTADAPNASIGSLSEAQDPGVTTQYQRDALARVVRKTQIVAGGGTRTTSYSYVPAGQGGAGSLQSITYPSGKTLVYSYESTGQVTAMQWAGSALVSGLEWNPMGQPTHWTWPGIKTSPTNITPLTDTRDYNTAGQLISSNLMDLTWDAAGRVTAIKQSQMLPGSAGATAQSAMISSSFN